MADTRLSPWKRILRQASFRGVPFHIDDRELEGGRRIENHEYPKRSNPPNFPEDMGRRTREWSVDGYVIGDDYGAQRDRLIAACEREGAGTYTDHWGLSHRVKCVKFRVRETSKEGRMCRFSLDFIEAGGGLGAAPFGIDATAVQLAGASASLISAAVRRFGSSFSR